MSTSLTLKYAARFLLKEMPLVAGRTRQLRRDEMLSLDEIVQRQEHALRRTLETAARTLPAYRSIRGQVPSKKVIEFLRGLPVIDRHNLLADRPRYYPHQGRPLAWWSVGKTSGTTGTPLDVLRSYDSTLWEQAFCRQHWEWAGWSPGQRQVVLRGDLVVPVDQSAPPYWFHDRVSHQLIVSSRHVNSRTVASVADAIARFAPVQMRAYPSAAYNLAVLMQDQGLRVQVRSIVTGSENLLSLQRQVVESTFEGRVFDHYGMAERVAFAMECDHGRLHVHPQYSFVEILDKNGVPTDGPGYVVGTTFHNHVMPLLRYRVTDMAQWGKAHCPCGRTYPYLEMLSGRVADQLFDRDRQVVSPGVVTFAFKGVPRIAKAQVAQVEVGRWLVRVVPLPAFGPDEHSLLLNNFSSLVSNRVDISIQLVDEIPTQASGKYKWISQEFYTRAGDPGTSPG